MGESFDCPYFCAGDVFWWRWDKFFSKKFRQFDTQVLHKIFIIIHFLVKSKILKQRISGRLWDLSRLACLVISTCCVILMLTLNSHINSFDLIWLSCLFAFPQSTSSIDLVIKIHKLCDFSSRFLDSLRFFSNRLALWVITDIFFCFWLALMNWK